MQFENFQNHEYLLFMNCTSRSCDILFTLHSTKLRRFHGNLIVGAQFGINCTTLDQSKLSNFVECTIIKTSMFVSYLAGVRAELSQ